MLTHSNGIAARYSCVVLWLTRIIGIAFVAITGLVSASASASVPDGVEWLAAQQQANGSFVNSSAKARPYHATTASLQALRRLDALESSGVEIEAASDYLSDADTDLTLELSLRLSLSTITGESPNPIRRELLGRAYQDGGFSPIAGFGSSLLDTAYALSALSFSGEETKKLIGSAISYIQANQNPDGGFAVGSTNESSVYVTSLVARALSRYRDRYPSVEESIAAARSFLTTRRKADGLWGEIFVSAHVLETLARIDPDAPGLLVDSANALAAAQSADGSWNGDVYSTALALRALQAFKELGNAVDGKAGLTGRVVLSGTSKPVGNVTVSLWETAGYSVRTAADGRFYLSGIPAGQHTLVASRVGFEDSAASVSVPKNTISDIGHIAIALENDKGLARFALRDQETGAAVQEATIVLGGPESVTFASSGNETTDSPGLEKGGYEFSITAPDYRDSIGVAQIAAGEVRRVAVAMVGEDAVLDDTAKELRGQVIDAGDGLPVAGASIEILGKNQMLTTDAQGRFISAPVARGDYDLQVEKDGYIGTQVTVTFPAGATGDIGEIALHESTGSNAPTSLTFHITVEDELTGAPVSGANVQVTDTDISGATDEAGEVTLSTIRSKSFDFQITATDYLDIIGSVEATGWGEYAKTIKMKPAGETDAESVTLHGKVTDSETGEPIASALVRPSIGLETRTDSDGRYETGKLGAREFDLYLETDGYRSRSMPIALEAFGSFQLDVALEPVGERQMTLDQVQVPEAPAEPDSIVWINAELSNRTDAPGKVLVLGEVWTASGELLASFSPVRPGTQEPQTEFELQGGESISLSLPWHVRQTPPGTYTVRVRLVEPGTINAEQPRGTRIDQQGGQISVLEGPAISGRLDLAPPLIQFGEDTAVQLSGLLRNSGNVRLGRMDYQMVVTDPQGKVLLNRTAPGSQIAVNEVTEVNFGNWVPTRPGNLVVTVRPVGNENYGAVTRTLYVGNKASAEFTVSETTVPAGTQTVEARVNLSGVDVTQAVSTDPLFDLVKDAIESGSEFSGPKTISWHQRNGCLGCHVQSQTAFGMGSALNKADVDPVDTRTAVNYIATNSHNDGRLQIVGLPSDEAQTALGLWGITAFPDQDNLIIAAKRALEYLYERRIDEDGLTYWDPDGVAGWFRDQLSMTALVVQSAVRILEARKDLRSAAGLEYKSDQRISYDSGHNPTDMVAYDDRIYIGDWGGIVTEFDPETGEMRRFVGEQSDSFRGGTSMSIDVDDNGNLYQVGLAQWMLKTDRQGNYERIPLPGGQYKYYYGVAVGDDGNLYVSSGDDEIFRIQQSGEATLIASGGLLNSPRDLEAQSDGTILIANHGSHNILKMTLDGDLSVWTGGIGNGPIRLHSRPDGTTYVAAHGAGGKGVIKIAKDGVASRVLKRRRTNGVIEYEGKLITTNTRYDTLWIEKLVSEDEIFQEVRESLPAIAKFALDGAYGNSDLVLPQAFRLVTLGEIRPYLSESALVADIDKAVVHLESDLRARQNPDGGWSKRTSVAKSDPLTTAWVGMALEYTNPSPEDPMLRSSIKFLLNTQAPDGSWPNIKGYFDTRLSSTGMVLAYLPKALERLGSIDIGLDLSFGPDTVPSNFVPGPEETTSGDDGTTGYHWMLSGVTGQGRAVNFDLTLQNLKPFDERKVAEEASLTFRNSFTGVEITSPIEIPSVRAVSGIDLEGVTDKSVYSANEPVQITGIVSAMESDFPGGTLEFSIVPEGGSEPIAKLSPVQVSALEQQSSVELEAGWNTGTHPAGDYLVRLSLYDKEGVLQARDDVPFEISVTGTLVDAVIRTDRQVYEAWDDVTVSSRVINETLNAVLPETLARVSIEDPGGAVVLEDSFPVRQLGPGAYEEFRNRLSLVDAPSGGYVARIHVFDAAGEVLLAESSTSFSVDRTKLQAIGGEVSASPRRQYQGEPVSCLETVKNRAGSTEIQLVVVSELVSMSNEEMVTSDTREILIAAGGADSQSRQIDTDDLEPGGYACRLVARLADGSEKILDYDLFTILEPPIEIEAAFTRPIGIGRVLVLLDEPGRFVRDESCTGVEKLRLEHDFSSRLPEGTEIDIRLLNGAGSELDRETATSPASTVNQLPGSEGANLSIDEFGASRASVALQGPALSDASHRVTATVSRPDGQGTELDSGFMEPACGLEDQIDQPFGDFVLAAVHAAPRVSTDEPYGPEAAGTLAAQRDWLETVLDRAGWSYTIVENADAFTSELRTGAYRAYAIFSERIKLATEFQKEIREAVYRGEGLMVAGPHDDRNHFVFEPLGVKQQGKHSDVDKLMVENSPVQDAMEVPLRLEENPERIRLEGASVAARFEPSKGNGQFDVAETYYPFGSGVGIYGAFDLPVQGHDDGTTGAYADLLLNALSYAYPVSGPEAGHPVPVTLTLSNQGVAVDGRVLLTTPDNVTVLDASAALESVGGDAGWSFRLAEEATQELTLWLSAPATPVELQARIQVLVDEAYEDYEIIATTLAAGAVADPETISGSLDELATRYKPLKHITRDFERGLADYRAGNFGAALETWLKLADRIQQHAEPSDALNARVGLSRMIRVAEMRL